MADYTLANHFIEANHQRCPEMRFSGKQTLFFGI